MLRRRYRRKAVRRFQRDVARGSRSRCVSSATTPWRGYSGHIPSGPGLNSTNSATPKAPRSLKHRTPLA